MQPDAKSIHERAYAAGIRDVIDLARKAAAAMPSADLHATRSAFAEVALLALAVEAEALIPKTEGASDAA